MFSNVCLMHRRDGRVFSQPKRPCLFLIEIRGSKHVATTTAIP